MDRPVTQVQQSRRHSLKSQFPHAEEAVDRRQFRLYYDGIELHSEARHIELQDVNFGGLDIYDKYDDDYHRLVEQAMQSLALYDRQIDEDYAKSKAGIARMTDALAKAYLEDGVRLTDSERKDMDDEILKDGKSDTSLEALFDTEES